MSITQWIADGTTTRPHPWRPGDTGAPYHRALTVSELIEQITIAPPSEERIFRLLIFMANFREAVSYAVGVFMDVWQALRAMVEKAVEVVHAFADDLDLDLVS
jgi:hypothetical protein